MADKYTVAPTPAAAGAEMAAPEKAAATAVAPEHHEDVDLSRFADDPEDGKMTFQAIMVIVSFCCVYNAYLFTLIMPGVVLAAINADLGPSPSYPWITIVWNLSAAVIVTVGGRLTDIFGRRWFLMFGAFLGALGSLVGALGQNIPQMIAAGVLMGCGGGFQEIIFAAVQEVVPNKHRLLALGCVEVSNVIGNFSPIIATMYNLRSPLHWRACYWHAFACESAAVVALYFWYKPPSFETKHRADGKTRLQLLRELDYVGLFLFTAGCAILLLALNWGGREHPWKSAAVIAPILVSAFTFGALACWETYYPLRYPILPPDMFRRSPQFCVIVVVVFINGMLYYSCNVLWPREAAVLFAPANNAVIGGVYANIFSFGTIASFAIVLGFVPNVGHERWQMVGFLVIQVSFIGGMASVGVHDVAKAIVFVMIISMTIAPINFLNFGMASLALEDQGDIGVSQGILSTARLIGGAIATAIYVAILQNRNAELFAPRVTQFAQDAGFTGNVTALVKAASNGTAAAYNAVPGITNQTIVAAKAGIKQASADSFHLVYLVALAFGGVAIIVAMTTKDIPKEKKTAERAVHLENEHYEMPPLKTVA